MSEKSTISFGKIRKRRSEKTVRKRYVPKKQVSFEKIRKRRSEKTCRKKFVRKSRSEKSTMEFGRNGSNCVFMISVDLGLTSRIARIQRLTYTSNSYINPSLLPSFILLSCFVVVAVCFLVDLCLLREGFYW
jgi:hypothetical protein